ncbi:ribonuclease P subunit p20 family protein [Aspergillus brunneoviolaceus CBS 621.78]|uniref:Uncharacterized protein n=1 Tax=Aspergillus brunneoviolaceus CBS 621.78 TaxID=1450534 RepID=A0ACD1FYG2_9EURO|nr:hypothetical protein BO95DRAFT_421400 [Aspergillus brunneoviolaceus CBS 621.78]RAH42058.1 hypothetical protein BO95DRAFT_421400 [Aspergillus brunneoviolaceus CBS 621.78]
MPQPTPPPPTAPATKPHSHPESLTFTKKNQNMTKLPKYAKITKRPIPHPAPSTPYTGSNVPKTIYVSTTTPKMSVVTRVRKLLRQAEKRATAGLHSTKGGRQQHGGRTQAERVAQVQEALRREEVHVKATGRAIAKAVAVGEYLRDAAGGGEFRVTVTTGSVLVVDDVEVDEAAKKRVVEGAERMRREVESGSAVKGEKREGEGEGKGEGGLGEEEEGEDEEEELPESRTRWVNMVDVVVGLK